MLRIRLSRVGKKKQPSYRIVVADSRAPRDGAFLEIIGHYDPLPDPPRAVVKEEEAIRWLQRGAQPSEAAAKILNRLGLLERAGKAGIVQPLRTEPAHREGEAAEAPASEPSPATPENELPAETQTTE